MKIIVKKDGKVIRTFDHYQDAQDYVDAECDTHNALPKQFELIELVNTDNYGKEEIKTNH